MRASLQGPKGDRGDKGPQGAQGNPGATGLIGPTGASGQTICHYVFPITTTILKSELPSPHVGVSTPSGWNTYRNSSTHPSYISWNNSNQLASTKLCVSWIDGSGVNVRKFLSMLKINDVVTIQSKTNHALSQEWKLTAAPVPHDNFMEFSITLANSNSAQLPPTENHAMFIFVYSGNALANANATEARIAALEERITTLTARLAAAGIS